jgi:hypothetical protein
VKKLCNGCELRTKTSYARVRHVISNLVSFTPIYVNRKVPFTSDICYTLLTCPKVLSVLGVILHRKYDTWWYGKSYATSPGSKDKVKIVKCAAI